MIDGPAQAKASQDHADAWWAACRAEPKAPLNTWETLSELDEARRHARLTPARERWMERARHHHQVVAIATELLRLLHVAPALPAASDFAYWLVALAHVRCLALRRFVYAARRIGGLNKSIGPRIIDCGRHRFTAQCGCRWFVGEFTCRQAWLCGRCRRAVARRRSAKLAAALEQRLADEQARFERDAARVRSTKWTRTRSGRDRRRKFGGLGSKDRHLADSAQGHAMCSGRDVRIVMMTITIRHSGDVALDHERIWKGFTYFRKKYHSRWGRFPYAQIWEVTPGADGLGHVHAHVALIIPWRPFATLRRWFVTGCGRDPEADQYDASEQPDPQRRGRSLCEHVNFSTGYSRKGTRRKSASTGRSAAKYLAKYVSKGVDVAGFSAELRADVSACFYSKRSISTSWRFWVPRLCACEHCGEHFVRVEAPSLHDELRLPSWDATAPPESA